MNDPTAGLGFLGDIDGLFIQQKLELFEAFTGERSRRHSVTERSVSPFIHVYNQASVRQTFLHL